MPRIAERRERPIRIYQLVGRERCQVGEVRAFNLPDAIRRWHETQPDLTEPHFQANTVSVITLEGEEELYVATD